MKLRYFSRIFISAFLVLALHLAGSGYAAVPTHTYPKAPPEIKQNILIPTITITSPQSGASWYAGDSYTVTWTYSGKNPPKFTLALYKNDQPANPYSLTNVVGNQAVFTVPYVAAGTYEIWVTSQDNPNVVGKQTIKVEKSSLTITSPTPGRQSVSIKPIRWNYAGKVGTTVKITHVNIDKGIPLTVLADNYPIGTGGTGEYIPTKPVNGTITVQSVQYPNIFAKVSVDLVNPSGKPDSSDYWDPAKE